MPLQTTKPDGAIPASAICIYGPSGVGKTTMLGTMPGKGLIIDVPQVEGGTFVVADKADRIDIFTCDEWDQINEVYWAVKNKEVNYNWIGVDSITGMQELAKRKVIGERDRGLKADPHKITLPEWGQIGQLIGELVFRFRKDFSRLGVWTIWTAQERKHGGGDDDPGPVMIGPDLIRSSLAALRPAVMVLGRISLSQSADGGWERTLRTGPHPLYMAKCRALPGRDMPPVTTTLNLNTILKYLLADGKRPREHKEEFASIIIE